MSMNRVSNPKQRNNNQIEPNILQQNSVSWKNYRCCLFWMVLGILLGCVPLGTLLYLYLGKY